MFLEIFAYNIFNNNHAEPSVFTNDEEFNEAATVTNLFDWWIAYNSFVKPLYTTFCPYDYNDDRFRAWEELEITMQTAMKDPQFEIVCGFSRELEGGNE